MTHSTSDSSGSRRLSKFDWERLLQEWEDRELPSFDSLSIEPAGLTPVEVSELLRIDQRRRWSAGTRVPAEDYLARFSELCHDHEAVVDFLFGEFILLERQGEKPDRDAFVARFPEFGDTLGAQIDLHRAGVWSVVHPSPTITSDNATPHLGQNAALDTALILPRTLGRYRLSRKLGRGGMGAVYLARDTVLDRDVAIKIPRGDITDPRLLERFEREARVAARLTRPGICPVYDFGVIDGIRFVSLAYIKGESLAEFLALNPLVSVEQAVEWTREIASAMSEAHRAGVLHRDLKPSNIMLDERKRPIVTDFGLARCDDLDAQRFTTDSTVLGTPAYSAPEQLSGSGDRGPTTDVYGLGIVFYELLCGRPPFRGSVGTVIKQVLTDAAPPPSKFRPELDPRLDDVCQRAIHKDPDRRLASMDEFDQALESYQRLGMGQAPRSRPAKHGQTAETTLLANRLRWSVAGVALLSIAVLAYFLFPKDRRVSSNDTSVSAPALEAGAIPLLPRNGRATVADGAIADVNQVGRTLTLDASGARSPQIWLDFPDARGAGATIRLKLRVSAPTAVGFAKIVFNTQDKSESFAFLSRSANETRAWLTTADQKRRAADGAGFEFPAGDEFLDIEVKFLEKTESLAIGGRVLIERPRANPGVGHVALAVSRWRVEIENPRAIILGPAPVDSSTTKSSDSRSSRVSPSAPLDLLTRLPADPDGLSGWPLEDGRPVSSPKIIVNNLKFTLPIRRAYEITCTFTPLEPDDAIYWVLPVGSGQALYGLNAYPKEGKAWRGFGSIHGKPIPENGSGVQHEILSPGQSSTLRLRVSLAGDEAELSAWWNNEPAQTYRGPLRDLSLPASYEWPEQAQFGVGTVLSKYRIDSFSLTELALTAP